MPQQQRAVTWPFVDMVRASSALLVMFGHVRFFHFQGIANVADPGPFTMFFYLVSGLQHEAVVLFFVISGFLVGGPIVGDISSRRFDAWRYLVNRFVRIYIVFVPSLVLVWVLYALVAPFLAGTRILAEIPAGPEGFFLNFRQFLCHAVCLQGLACSVWTKNPLLWSLGFEWALYLFAPLIVTAWFAPAAWIWRAVAVLLSVAAFATVSPGDVEWLFWV